MNKKDNKPVNDDEVMITSSISDLEKMLEGVEQNTNNKVERTMLKFEKLFFPALLLFGLLALGGFFIIYSITIDMTKLAKAMDPKMGKNMSAMVVSIDNLSTNVAQMNQSVFKMQKDFASVNKNMFVVAKKLDNLDNISTDMGEINQKMGALEPMLVNMQDMNKNMIGMQKSMHWMQRDISILRSSFARPMSLFNSMPIP